MSSPRLSDCLEPGQNSFTLIRLVLAVLVVVSHSFVLASGNRIADPFTAWTGYSLGDHAVNVFFVLSGIVTTASLLRLRAPGRFIIARLLRVVPAVAVFAVIFALIVAPLLSSLPAARYFSGADVPLYIIRTVAFAPGHPLLPGVFATNPMALITNEPLWTVKYELICYLALALAGVVLSWRSMELAASARLLGFAAAAVIAGYILTTAVVAIELPDTLGHLRRFMYCFAIGVACFVAADRVRLDWRWLAVLAMLYAVTYSTPLQPATSVLLTGYAALLASTIAFGRFRALANRYDLSYGTYVFGWPVGQVLIALVPSLSVAALAIATLTIVLPLAALSWIFVEQPALRLKGWLAPKPATHRGQLAAAE